MPFFFLYYIIIMYLAYMTKDKDITAPLMDTNKRLVTFDLPPEEQEKKEEELLSPCVTSPTIDINAHLVPDTMLVALFDRSSEMKELVCHNKAFFSTLATHLDTKWSRFENTLYCDRSSLSDIEWMKRISKALSSVPSLLEKFKELVGYLGDEEEDEQDFFSNVDITMIRPKVNRISKQAYPQFYANCQQTMKEDYQPFIDTLFDTNLTNIAWKLRLEGLLKKHVNILNQLQEIIAYEIEE